MTTLIKTNYMLSPSVVIKCRDQSHSSFQVGGGEEDDDVDDDDDESLVGRFDICGISGGKGRGSSVVSDLFTCLAVCKKNLEKSTQIKTSQC